MNELTILRAASVAANWHSTQRRKGANQEPYIEHLLEVAHLVGAADPA
jgi:(p)ppGpp synthase/HD superfamily hydrolase